MRISGVRNSVGVGLLLGGSLLTGTVVAAARGWSWSFFRWSPHLGRWDVTVQGGIDFRGWDLVDLRRMSPGVDLHHWTDDPTPHLGDGSSLACWLYPGWLIVDWRPRHA